MSSLLLPHSLRPARPEASARSWHLETTETQGNALCFSSLSFLERAAGRFGLRLSEREFLERDNREKSGQGVGKTKSQSLPWKIRENDCFCLPKVSKQIGFLRAPLLPLHLLGDIRETPRTAWKSQVATARCREGSLLPWLLGVEQVCPFVCGAAT